MKHGVWLLALLLLAGCAHEGARKAPASSGGTPAAGDRGVVDNIQLPQSERYAREHDAGPTSEAAALAKVATLREPIPKVEPRSRYGNGPTYRVRGRTYHVLDSALGYHATGRASWYGSKFHGHLTSSMEPYDMYKFTAAHTTLPLPSYVRVTNLDNGKSVIVRVNDRGPFHDNRLIDLSWAAAVRLGVWKKGTAPVRVDAIDPRHPAEPAPAPAVTPSARGATYLQVGAYADADNAAQMLRRVRDIGVAGAQIQASSATGRKLLHVRIGPLSDRAAVERARDALQHHGIASMPVEIPSSSEE